MHSSQEHLGLPAIGCTAFSSVQGAVLKFLALCETTSYNCLPPSSTVTTTTIATNIPTMSGISTPPPPETVSAVPPLTSPPVAVIAWVCLEEVDMLDCCWRGCCGRTESTYFLLSHSALRVSCLISLARAFLLLEAHLWWWARNSSNLWWTLLVTAVSRTAKSAAACCNWYS